MESAIGANSALFTRGGTAALPTLPAPYTVGSVVTDEGAIERAILDVPPGTLPKPGTVMGVRGPTPR